jgi:hypothetical protein
MAINFTGRDTREIVAVIEQFNRPRTFLLDTFFPRAVYSNNQFLDFEEILRGRHMAPIVHQRSPGRDVRSGGFDMRAFEPPLMKPLEPVDPNRAIQRVAGEALGGEMTVADRYELIKLDMLLEQRKSVLRRMEWYAANCLRSGSVTVTGEGYAEPITINYQRKSTLTKALVTTARWGEDGVDPSEDIEIWMQELQDESGFAPTHIVLDPKAWRLARPFLKDVLDNRRQASGSMELGPVSVGDDVTDARYLGALGDIEFWLYQESVTDDDGSATKLMPDHTVLIGSNKIEGVRGYGALISKTHGFLPLEYGQRVFEDVKTEQEYVETQSKGIPIPARPNAFMAITVR